MKMQNEHLLNLRRLGIPSLFFILNLTIKYFIYHNYKGKRRERGVK